MAAPTTAFFNGIASLDQNVFRPIVRKHAQDLISAATLKVDEFGKPVDLDMDRNQEGFHPYAAIFIATTLAWAILGVTNMVCNIVVPYSIRSHVMMATKMAVGSCLFHFIGTAIDSIRKQSQGDPSRRPC